MPARRRAGVPEPTTGRPISDCHGAVTRWPDLCPAAPGSQRVILGWRVLGGGVRVWRWSVAQRAGDDMA